VNSEAEAVATAGDQLRRTECYLIVTILAAAVLLATMPLLHILDLDDVDLFAVDKLT
jgi:hypothetical protein